LFVVVREQDPETPPYRIENRAMNHIVLFRQRGCTGHPWNMLRPGETKVYSWEEPMKPRKLSVKLGSINLSLRDEDGISDEYKEDDVEDESASDAEINGGRAARLKQVLSAHYVDSEERGGFGAIRTVKLEEIGFSDQLPCPGVRDAARSSPGHHLHRFLNCQVDTDGATRVLIVSDHNGAEDRGAMRKHMSLIERQIKCEESRMEKLRILKAGIDMIISDKGKDDEQEVSPLASELTLSNTQPSNVHSRGIVGENGFSNRDNASAEMAEFEDQAKRMADLPEGNIITRRNQVIVEVLEATGLRAYEVTGFCNPYCEIVLKERSKAKRSFFSGSKIRKRTYFIERTLAPKWTNQIFVFDVPEEAASATRGHAVQFRMRNFKFIGSHPHLGQTNIHLRSLRNQQEFVGWYPLIGRTGRRELEDSQANWGRGSLKLRVQWVYTVPALLDYFLLLSERQLAELSHSLAGMKQQLEHLIKTEALTKGMKEISIGKIPNILGFRAIQKQFLQQGIPRVPFDAQEVTKKIKWTMGSMTDPLRQSRDNLMWLLYFQTQESRNSRRRGKIEPHETSLHTEGPHAVKERLACIAEQNDQHDENELDLQNEHNSIDNSCGGRDTSLTFLKNASMKDLYLSSMADHLAGSVSGSNSRSRSRSFSTEDDQFEHRFNRDVFDFAMRARSLTYDGTTNGRRSLLEVDAELFATNTEDEAIRTQAITRLFHDGLLYHRKNEYCHKRNLTYRFRAALIETQGAAQSSFRLKSPHRLEKSMKHFRSWTAALAVLNDENLEVIARGCEFEVRLRHEPESEMPIPKVEESSIGSSLSVDCDRDEGFRSFVIQKLELPSFAPPSMQRRARQRAQSMYLARSQFERASMRSLRAVLNPGGWLTIRPITALNLSDAFTGMHVKLRYGSESITTQTVEARVTPSWASEPSSNNDGSSRNKISNSSPRTNIVPDFQFSENDLQIYIEPQKTSGALRLSVVGERMNQHTELGVLYIPLGAAVGCCIECMEEFLERGRNVILHSPMYVRWFPLISPKDAVSVDGDMGNSCKPLEREQLQDSLFANYFTPCIKLALVWQPNQEQSVSVTSPSETDDQYLEDEMPLTEKYVNADFARISMSLIDSQRAIELFSLAFSDIDVRFSVTKGKTRVGLVIGWIQVDHQDPKARESVVLAPTPGDQVQPILQFLAVKDNLRSKGKIDSYEYIGISLQELDVTIEEAFVLAVWEFIISVVRRREVKRKVAGGLTVGLSRSRDRPSLTLTTMFRSGLPQYEENPESQLYDELFGDNSSGELFNDQKVYIEQLLLGFVKINLSYLKGKRGNWELTEGGEFITKSIDGLTQNLPEKVAIATGGLKLGGGRKREAQSDMMAKWASYTHDEDLWTDAGGGEFLRFALWCDLQPTLTFYLKSKKHVQFAKHYICDCAISFGCPYQTSREGD
jgi:hypothetical protein